MSLRGGLLNWTVWNGCNDRLQNILEDTGNKNNIKNKKLMIMTTYKEDNDSQQQIIRCPNCRKQIKIDELYEYANNHPESKREAMEHEIDMWGLTSYYDRQYYVENVVIFPSCVGIPHVGDWVSSRGGSKK